MYLRTDEEAEAAEALCFASHIAEALERDIRSWRWVFIALHNAVQGFMVLSLRHGNGLAALSKESACAWLEAHKKGSCYPENEFLDDFLSLYKKIKCKSYGEMGRNKRFIPQGTQGKSIKQLNSIRNDFIHFTPKGWSLEVNGLPKICLDSLSLIEFLVESDNIAWYEPSYKEQSYDCCQKLRKQMKHLEKEYKNIDI